MSDKKSIIDDANVDIISVDDPYWTIAGALVAGVVGGFVGAMVAGPVGMVAGASFGVGTGAVAGNEIADTQLVLIWNNEIPRLNNRNQPTVSCGHDARV